MSKTATYRNRWPLICTKVQILEQSDKVVAEAIATEYREQVLVSYAVKGMLKIKSEDKQREMYLFCVGRHVPRLGCGVKNRIAGHPTVLRGFKMQVYE